MKDLNRPVQEALRLQALEALDIPFLPLEERFDRITRTLTRLFKTPVAYLSLIDRDTQWFKSIRGLDVLSVPIDNALCRHTLESKRMCVCEDFDNDERFKDSGNALHPGFQARFYASVPLFSQGQIIGTLAIADSQPRSFSNEEIVSLKDMASWAQTELHIPHADPLFLLLGDEELLPEESIDPETRLWNPATIRKFLRKSFDEHLLHLTPISVLLIGINQLNEIEQQYGQDARHQILQTYSSAMRQCLRADDLIGRYDDDKFLIVLNDCDPERSADVAKRIYKFVSDLQFHKLSIDHQPITCIGVAGAYERGLETENQLLEHASLSLQEASISQP